MSAPLSLEIFAGFAMFALIFITLERVFPLRQQRVLRPGWTTDVTYYVVGCFVGHLSNALSIAPILFLRWGLGIDSGGIAQRQPEWLQFLEIFLIADFCAYFYHRAAHQFPWLWRIHRIHHSTAHMDWLANVRLHPVDKILGDCLQFIPIFLLGFSDTALLAYVIVLGFQGFINHSNIKMDFGPLRWIIASPTFHHWHHTTDPNLYNINFAPHLVIFDFLFGTAYLPRDHARPESYCIDETIPKSFWGQLIHPFLKRNPSVERASE